MNALAGPDSNRDIGAYHQVGAPPVVKDTMLRGPAKAPPGDNLAVALAIAGTR